jgi:ABC-type multidrug transport system fused ATPase/permease subunit
VIAKEPETLRKFLKVACRAWEYSLTHPEEAIDILAKYHPINKTDYLGSFKIVQDVFKTDNYKNNGIGNIQPEKMQSTWDLVNEFRRLSRTNSPTSTTRASCPNRCTNTISRTRTTLCLRGTGISRYLFLVSILGKVSFPWKKKPLLSIRNFKKVFTTRDGVLEALGSVTFNVYPEEFVSIVGPSGCGKTTLLKIVAGLSKQSESEIIVDRANFDPAREVGFVFQKALLIRAENIQDAGNIGRLARAVLETAVVRSLLY